MGLYDFELTPEDRAALLKAVRGWNGTITFHEARLKLRGLEKEDNLISIPPRRTLKGEVEKISSYDDFEAVMNELELIRKPGMLNFSGHIELSDPKRPYNKVFLSNIDYELYNSYEGDERLSERELNREHIPELDEMSAPAYAATMDGTDLYEADEGEIDTSVEEEITPLVEWERKSQDSIAHRFSNRTSSKAKNYLTEWQAAYNFHSTMNGYRQLIDDIDYLYENYPRDLERLFNMGYRELDIPWINISNPTYIEIEFEKRHVMAVRFVHEQRALIEGEHGQENRKESMKKLKKGLW